MNKWYSDCIKLVLNILSVFIPMSTLAGITNPDFAYPRTVYENASAEMAKFNLSKPLSVADCDRYLALELQYYYAQQMIDRNQATSVITELSEKVPSVADNTLRALLRTLLAKMYLNYYKYDIWRYDDRTLPLTPFPADPAQWSGEMFKIRISELCKQAFDEGIDISTPLSEFPLSIEAPDKLSFVCYPAVADFIAAGVVEICEQASWDDLSQELTRRFRATLKEGTAPYITWALVELEDEEEDGDVFQKLLALYNENADSPDSALILCLATDKLNLSNPHFDEYEQEDEDEVFSTDNGQKINDEYRPAVIASLIESYLNRYPASSFNSTLKELLARLRSPFVEVKFDSYCSDSRLKVAVRNRSARDVEICVYPIPDEIANDYQQMSHFNLRQPVDVVKQHFDLKAPFCLTDTITVSLPAPGYYAIVPHIKGLSDKDKTNKRMPEPVRRVPIIPITLSNVTSPGVLLVKSDSGAPVSGARLTSIYKGRKQGTIITDEKGLGKFSNRDRITDLSATFEGREYTFPANISNLRANSEAGSFNSANVLTDRSLYHPGDELHFLIVATHYESSGKDSELIKPSLLKGEQLRVVLKNANYQSIDTLTATTDEYGRISGSFSLPNEGLTGSFSLMVTDQKGMNIGNGSVTVSDYKAPQFEIASLIVNRNAPTEGSVSIDGTLRTFSGMPVAYANVEVRLSRIEMWRWWWNEAETLASFTVISDAEGKFTAVFTPEMLPQDSEKSNFYRASFSVKAPSGETVDGSCAFATGKPYSISVEDFDNIIDTQNPFNLPCRVVDPNGEEHKINLLWRLTDKNNAINAEGILTDRISLSDIRPGKYTFTVSPADTTLAEPYSTTVILYNVASGIIPSENRIWTPKPTINSIAEAKKILVTTSAPQTTLYAVVNVGDSIRSVTCRTLPRGYHYIDADLADDCLSAKISLLTTCDCRTTNLTIDLYVRENTKLKIEAESLRERLSPGTIETWKFRILDSNGSPVKAALVLDLYNKALEKLSTHSLRLGFNAQTIWNRLRINFPYNYLQSNYEQESLKYQEVALPSAPIFNNYGQAMDFGTSVTNSTLRRGRMMKTMSAGVMYDDGVEMEEKALALSDSVMMSEGTNDVATEESENTSDSFDYRLDEVPVALWAPMLTTDDAGIATISFTVPNAVTTWRLLAAAWDENTEVGRLIREFVANKPLMVQPLTPRYLRHGDVAQILSTVYNNTDSALAATVVFEIFDPLSGKNISADTLHTDLPAGGQRVVSFELSTLTAGIENMAAVGIRVKAVAETYSDGELTVLPILASESRLVETEPFYLNPDNTEYSTTLPSATDARISLTYCANPAWSVVSALPGLREHLDYANSCAAAIFSACSARGILADNPEIARTLRSWADTPGDSTLISNLQKNEDLKIALLSATPWVLDAMSDTERMQRLSLIFDPSATDKSISSAIEALGKLQSSDGGFYWSEWCSRPSLWTTLNVLCMINDLNLNGRLPDDAALRKMIDRALKYVDANVENTDMVYTAIRPTLSNIRTISPAGSKVIKETCNEILKDWKGYSPSIKAIAAVALYRNGYHTKAKELLASLQQFSVRTADQGTTFPNVNSLAAYASILKAYALIEPASDMVDGLRQQLIVRKQGTDWGTSVITTEVVSAILSCGTKWTSSQSNTRFSVDSTPLTPANNLENGIGTTRFNLSPYRGQTLKITRSSEQQLPPAYGAVYARFSQKMTQVKASACDDLSIEKRLYKREGTQWVNCDTLQVGDRVKVNLLITTKRNLNYVSVIDERPAAFAPVDQLPGWLYSDGAAFYRENRDAFTSLGIEWLSPGTYILEYEMNVQHAGSFSSGVASIQSQYSPEISAHSAGSTLIVNP